MMTTKGIVLSVSLALANSAFASNASTVSDTAKAPPVKKPTFIVPPLKQQAASDSLELARKSGCLACHSVDMKVVGPAWNAVADRYRNDPAARSKLDNSIKKGSRGKWSAMNGGVPMPPNSPRVSDADVAKLVDFILSLGK